MTSDTRPSLTATDTAFHVEAYEKIDYTLRYVTGAFEIGHPELADSYRPFGRCLMVVDQTVYSLYGDQMHAYFDYHGIELTIFPLTIRETAKTLRTAERIVDAFGEFGLVRTEPVLVVGGGLGGAAGAPRRGRERGHRAHVAASAGRRRHGGARRGHLRPPRHARRRARRRACGRSGGR